MRALRLLSIAATLAVTVPAAASAAPPRQVLERAQDVSAFRLAANGRGDRVVTLPHDTTPGPTQLDIFTAPPRAAFGPLARLSGTALPDYDGRSAVGPDGTVALVGTPFTQVTSHPDRLVALVRPPGGEFGPPEEISRPGAEDANVAFDPQGNATAIWVRGADFVETSTRPPGGTWSPPVVIARNRPDASEPQIAFDAAGDAIATWVRSGSPEPSTRVKAAGRKHKAEVMASFRRAGGAFGKPQRVSDRHFDSEEASVAVNRSGRVGVVWVSNTPHDHFRVGSAFGSIRNGLGRPRFLTRPRDDATGSTIVMDDRGRSLITWRVLHGPDSDPQANYRFDIRLARRPAGGPVSAARPITSAHAELAQLGVAPGGRGVVGWIQYGRRKAVVRARLVTTGGAIGHELDVSPRGWLDDLAMTVDRRASATFVWTNDAKRMRLEAATLAPPRAAAHRAAAAGIDAGAP